MRFYRGFLQIFKKKRKREEKIISLKVTKKLYFRDIPKSKLFFLFFLYHLDLSIINTYLTI